MIYHVFNSSLVSGPETLVFPALAKLGGQARILLLQEDRIDSQKQAHVEEYLQRLQLPYDKVSVRSRFDRQAIQKMAQLFKSFPQLQVVHAHDVKPSFYLWRALELLPERNFKAVSTHHGVHARSGFINHLYEEFYVRFILPRLDLSLVVCSSDRELLVRRGVPADKVAVHLNGVTRPQVLAEQRPQVQKDIRRKWQIQDFEGLVFGVVARLAPEKRHGLLLKVLQEVRLKNPDFKFKVLCFGRGELEASLRQQTQSMGLAEFVQWQGYRSGIGEESAGFDGILSLSRAEGLPINLIEAGWAGTPVFASSVDGVPDLISSVQLGTLVSAQATPAVIAEKLLDFASSAQALQGQGLLFQAHVEKYFSEQTWLKELFQHYGKIGVEGLK